MIITKEEQEVWLREYLNDGHTFDEAIGFIDGLNKAFSIVKIRMSNQSNDTTAIHGTVGPDHVK